MPVEACSQYQDGALTDNLRIDSPLGNSPNLVAQNTKEQVHRLRITPPLSPTALTPEVVHEVQSITRIHGALCHESDLQPKPSVNSLLTELVDHCIVFCGDKKAAGVLQALEAQWEQWFGEYVEKLLDSKTLRSAQTRIFHTGAAAHLRAMSSIAEGELEHHWAVKLLEKDQDVHHKNKLPSRRLLEDFPYYQNYLDLSRLEISLLENFISCNESSSSKILFIGSGPLPLTSFCLLDRYPHVAVHNIDRDEQALNLSEKLNAALGYGDRMSFQCSDVQDLANIKGFGVVYLAGLVGTTSEEKMQILASLSPKLDKGTLVAVRSARGLRTLLYPELIISEDALAKINLEVVAVVHPWTKVVNSMIILRKL